MALNGIIPLSLISFRFCYHLLVGTFIHLQHMPFSIKLHSPSLLQRIEKISRFLVYSIHYLQILSIESAISAFSLSNNKCLSKVRYISIYFLSFLINHLVNYTDSKSARLLTRLLSHSSIEFRKHLKTRSILVTKSLKIQSQIVVNG